MSLSTPNTFSNAGVQVWFPGLSVETYTVVQQILQILSRKSPVLFHINCSGEPAVFEDVHEYAPHSGESEPFASTANLKSILTAEAAEQYASQGRFDIICLLDQQILPASLTDGSTIVIGYPPSNWPPDEAGHVLEVSASEPHSAEDWAALLILLLAEPSVRHQLRHSLPSNPTIRLDGPFDSSYSLAIVNRELAKGLCHPDHKVQLSDPELEQRPLNSKFKQTHSTLASLIEYDRSRCPDVLLRNNYPPDVHDMRGRLNLFTQYAWEESAFPAAWIDRFNAHLNGMTVVSSLVKDIMRNNGLHIPVQVCPNGVDHLSLPAAFPEHRTNRETFTFLHVSSCFPRKGVDILLAAWGRAFRRADPVKLVIKSFDNPHNTIAEQLRQHQTDPDYPAVQLILDDYDTLQMQSLYQAADAFVAPSRAEGFGMPMAEAMAWGLPVIVTGHGGQTDFCNHETAWLVDYRFEYTDTHLGLFSSVWAEPDLESLSHQLNNVYKAPAEQVRRKCQRAFDYVQAHFRWNNIAQKTRDFIHTLAHAPARVSTPNILWVSTFNSRCGIATYSENLLCEIPHTRVTLLADRHSKPIGPDPDNLIRCLDWGPTAPDQIMQQVRNLNPDAVVIQHNHAFMSLDSLGHLLEQLYQHNTPSVVTLHNTHEPAPARGLNHAGFAQATRLLVHSTDDLNRLKDANLTRNTALFPHGVYQSDTSLDTAVLRQRLGLEGKRVIGSFGFLMPHKGIKELIQAFATLSTTHPELHLLLCNAEYPDEKSARELAECSRLIESLGLEDKVIREHRFLSDSDTLGLLSLCDLLVFPYQHTEESASGAVRMGIAASVPVLATPLPIFKDVAPAVHTLPGTTPAALATGIDTYLQRLDTEGKAALCQQADAWKQQHQWSQLSRRLAGMLRGLVMDRHAQR